MVNKLRKIHKQLYNCKYKQWCLHHLHTQRGRMLMGKQSDVNIIVYIYRDFEKAKPWTFTFKNINQTSWLRRIEISVNVKNDVNDVNNDVNDVNIIFYIYRDFEKAKPWTIAFKNINQTSWLRRIEISINVKNDVNDVNNDVNDVNIIFYINRDFEKAKPWTFPPYRNLCKCKEWCKWCKQCYKWCKHHILHLQRFREGEAMNIRFQEH